MLICNVGFRLFNKTTISGSDIKECDDNPCGKNAICIEEDPGYRCVCQDGYEGNGLYCKGMLSYDLVMKVIFAMKYTNLWSNMAIYMQKMSKF